MNYIHRLVNILICVYCHSGITGVYKDTIFTCMLFYTVDSEIYPNFLFPNYSHSFKAFVWSVIFLG